MLLLHHRLSVGYNDDRSADASSIRGDVDSLVVVVDEHTHELADAACTAKSSEVGYEARRELGEPDDGAVHVHDKGVRAIDFSSRGLADVYGIRKFIPGSRAHEYRMQLTFDPEHVGNFDDRFLIDIRCYVGHKRQILHKTTCLAFWRITRAEHTPLTGLKCAGARYLTCLLELRGYTSHHPKGRDEAEARKYVRDAGAIHTKTLERPITRRDRADESRGDEISLELHGIERVKLVSARWLLENFVDRRFEVRVVGLEQVLEQESKQLTSSEIEDEWTQAGRYR